MDVLIFLLIHMEKFKRIMLRIPRIASGTYNMMTGHYQEWRKGFCYDSQLLIYVPMQFCGVNIFIYVIICCIYKIYSIYFKIYIKYLKIYIKIYNTTKNVTVVEVRHFGISQTSLQYMKMKNKRIYLCVFLHILFNLFVVFLRKMFQQMQQIDS